jgi:ABC-type transporter Mla subunit MlaD
MPRLNTDRLKLELKRGRTPTIQIVFLLAAALFAASIVFTNQLYVRPWRDYNTYQVAFPIVKGVTPGKQPVRFAGVNVGVISGARVADNQAVLTLKINSKFGDFYRNARFRLRPLTPLQDMYVDVLSRGRPDKRKPGDNVLTSNYIVPATQNQAPVDISRVLDVFQPDVRARLHTLMAELGRGLKDNGQQLRASFAAVAPFLVAAKDATSALARRHRELATLVHNFGGVTKALAQRDTELTSLVRTGDQTLGSLAAADGNLSDTLRSFPPLLSRLHSSLASLQQTEGVLDPAISSLAPVAQKLKGGLDSLTKFGQEAEPALADLQPTVRAVRPLANQLRPTASSVRTAFDTLNPQTGDLNTITKTIPPCFFRIGSFFNNTISVLKFGDTNGAYPRATVGVNALSAIGKLDPGYTPRGSCVKTGNRLHKVPPQ